jgi:hypothetical protein
MKMGTLDEREDAVYCHYLDQWMGERLYRKIDGQEHQICFLWWNERSRDRYLGGETLIKSCIL